MPEENPSPAKVEELSSPEKAKETTIKLLTCSHCGRKEVENGPVFFYRKDRVFCSRPCADAGILIDQVDAVLLAEEDRARQLGALPPGYHGEDIDFEEFFEPLKLATEKEPDLEWGVLDELTDLPAQMLEAMQATLCEMHRCFDHTLPLSPRLRMRLLECCRLELFRLRADYSTEVFAKMGAA